ncbi:ABC transporter ATP-binding protein [uncultured Piscinibacter sp.]|uniref:ABC transporter ATP-binding protein n=1 Tax=uncultured Piscinibacter sp. TaxID=1131835 RepID=UPI002635353C|nr:ABC transporter ATP-binding protein [uncultured Piscinibacter sp.]
MLRLQGLAKRYGSTPVFSGVDLDLRAGEFVAVVGESGVGKSTLLNGIAGLDRLDAGSVCLDGREVTTMSEPDQAMLRRRDLGFVFQAFHVLPHLTVAQNVALPLLLLHRAEDARVERALDEVGLAGFGPRLPQTLSGGQLQRVAIARALVHGPKLLLADEPTGNLDAGNAERVMEVLVHRSRAHGTACLLVTHSHAAAARADRVMELRPDGLFAARAPRNL